MKKVFLFSCGLLVAFSVLLVSCEQDVDNEESSENGCFHNGHEYVDLGLPSGTKWATCNVGATEPWEYGGYYAWGETEEKDNYDWSTYKWCNGSYDTMTKYCIDSDYGTVDNKTILDLEDDVAHVKWGGSWRMPTIEEYEELGRLCTLVWCSVNNVFGCKVIGPNGNNVFFPAAGNVVVGWLNTLYNKEEDYAYCIELEFAESELGYDAYYREMGLSVRPVCK